MSTEIHNSQGTNDYSVDITKVCEGVLIERIHEDATIQIIEKVKYSEGEPVLHELSVKSWVDIMQKIRSRTNGTINMSTPPAIYNTVDKTYSFYFYFTSFGFIPFKKDVYAYKINVKNSGNKHVKWYLLNTPVQGAFFSNSSKDTLQGTHIKMKKQIMEATETTQKFSFPFADYIVFPDSKPDKFQYQFPSENYNDLDIDAKVWSMQNDLLDITKVDENGVQYRGLPNDTLVFDMTQYDTLKFFKSDESDLIFYTIQD